MNYDALLQSIVDLHQEALGRAALAVNRSLVLRNWLIGAYLVEFEQGGADRAAYGVGLLARLSRDLRQRAVKGVSPDVLERMRGFYLRYRSCERTFPRHRRGNPGCPCLLRCLPTGSCSFPSLIS